MTSTDPTVRYRTLPGPCRHEIDKIKGSRFIAWGLPIGDEQDLLPAIETARTEFPEANHHCWAWRLGDTFRYSDDGEPSGSAGRPILQRIDGKQLDRVALIVTRIFGGTKLGVGGLVRAYSAAAGELLEQVEIVEVIPTTQVTVTIPYPLSGSLQAAMTATGFQPVDSDFGEQVRHRFRIPCSQVDAFVAELTERTAGQARIEVEPPG